jgi:hypothetical protein
MSIYWSMYENECIVLYLNIFIYMHVCDNTTSVLSYLYLCKEIHFNLYMYILLGVYEGKNADEAWMVVHANDEKEGNY